MLGFKSRSDFGRNVAILMSGSIVAQVIPLIIAPILTRLYTPEEFGVYAVFFSVASIFTVIATARYEMAIMLPKSMQVSRYLVLTSISIAVFLSVISIVVILMSHQKINEYFGANVAFLIPIIIVTAGVHQSLKVWLNRNKKYKEMSLNRVEQSFFSAGSQLILSAFNFGSLGLIVGQILGQVFASIRLGVISDICSFFRIKRSDVKRVIASFKMYLYLIKFGVPALLTSRAAQESLIVLIGYFMSAGVVGFISLLNRVISVPASVLGTNLGEVFYQKITETKKNKSYPIVKAFVMRMLIISAPLYMVIYFALKYTFVWVFGDPWQNALEFAPYLIVVAALSFVFSPISTLFNYFEVQGYNLVWQSVWLATNILVFWIYDCFDLTIKEVFLFYAVKQSLLYVAGIVAFLLYSRALYHE